MVEAVQVGVVKELHLYPVKSMGGQAVDDLFLNWHGCDGDRKYAFVIDGNSSEFPWLTARQAAQMLHYRPQFVEPDKRATSAIAIKTPEGSELALESAALMQSLAAHYAHKFHLIHLGIGAFDDFPVSVISTATLDGLSAKVGFPVQSDRFRPNIVVETNEAIDAIEDQWVSHALRFGSAADAARIAVVMRDPRCVMVNLDRDTLKQTPELLREIAQRRDNCTGVFGSVLQTGSIKVGDPVFLS
ncbi:MAG: MOSC domain-containing protein [Anaerolineae bacterium]|nr:MOSC domain-containing protein [Anaerolineae bacterium]